jgi:hypothetical protein
MSVRSFLEVTQWANSFSGYKSAPNLNSGKNRNVSEYGPPVFNLRLQKRIAC